MEFPGYFCSDSWPASSAHRVACAVSQHWRVALAPAGVHVKATCCAWRFGEGRHLWWRQPGQGRVVGPDLSILRREIVFVTLVSISRTIANGPSMSTVGRTVNASEANALRLASPMAATPLESTDRKCRPRPSTITSGVRREDQGLAGACSPPASRSVQR
jgi:hypothetical protein